VHRKILTAATVNVNLSRTNRRMLLQNEVHDLQIEVDAGDLMEGGVD